MVAGALGALINRFERVRIISLPERTDRRRQLTRELSRADVAVDGITVAIHDATRPPDRGDFPSIGARGCFLSHLDVLRDAQSAGAASVLILEDDVTFAGVAEHHAAQVERELAGAEWDIFYGGYELDGAPAPGPAIRAAAPDEPLRTTHCLAFSQAAVRVAVPFLEQMLARPAGSPEGGPMHVDGAYCWLRQAEPELRTLLADPPVAFQRPSRTDIHDLRIWDRLPLIRGGVQLLRTARGRS